LKVALVALAVACPLAAQQNTPPAQVVTAATVHSTAEELLKQAKASPDGIAFQVLLTRPDGAEQIAVRVKSGQGEWHRDFADVFVGLEGSAKILVGGQLIHGKETAPGEMRGDSVQGGQVYELHAGDVLRIEPQVPHQAILAPGATLKYFVVKMKAPK
jgi:mannose-6-phosphate isomerase-like protein (cupin superfamily)